MRALIAAAALSFAAAAALERGAEAATASGSAGAPGVISADGAPSDVFDFGAGSIGAAGGLAPEVTTYAG